MSEPDALDIGSRILFKGRPGTIIGASPEHSGGPAWWTIRLDTGEIISPGEGSPYLHIWSPATPSVRLEAARRAWTRKVLEDVRSGYLQPEQAERVLDLVASNV